MTGETTGFVVVSCTSCLGGGPELSFLDDFSCCCCFGGGCSFSNSASQSSAKINCLSITGWSYFNMKTQEYKTNKY